MREYLLSIGGKKYKARVKSITTEYAQIVVNDREYRVELEQLGPSKAETPAVSEAKRVSPGRYEPSREAKSISSSSGVAGGVISPLPGLILEMFVKEGDTVRAGQDLLVMESMKMENRIHAPHDGVVKKVFVRRGDNVLEGDKLVEVTRPLMTTV